MLQRKIVWGIAAVGIMSLMCAGQAFAQPAGGGGGRGGRGGGGAGGGFNPARMQEMMVTRVKEALNATDDEWKALQPKVEKVVSLNLELRSASMAGMRMGRRPGATEEAAPATSDVEKAVQALEATTKDENAKAEDVTAKLKALRDARAKVKQELTTAQAELKALVTPKQEAQLVLMGQLD